MLVQANRRTLRTRHSLTPGREYLVLAIESRYYRLVDDDGDPVLFSPIYFRILDSTIPSDWIQTEVGTDDWSAIPPDLRERGFFEKYHDRDPEIIAQFEQYVRMLERTSGLQLGWAPPDVVHRRVVARIKADLRESRPES